jgi:hypothetical protein
MEIKMGLKEKFRFLKNNLDFPVKLLKLKKKLSQSRSAGKQVWVFQCDFKGHYPYLEPFYNYGKSKSDVEIYFAIGFSKNDNPAPFLISQGISAKKILQPIDYLRFTKWDAYVSPTEWGNVFPGNSDAFRVQIFHTLADKKIEYSNELLKFNVIFANGPVHHEFLDKYIFNLYPESRKKINVINAGYAKIDNLFNNYYSKKELKKEININVDDNRKIILYAPNWEATSALYKYGNQIIDILSQSNHLILIKLHYMSLIAKEDHDATISSENHFKFTKVWVDWRKKLEPYNKYENIRIINDQNLNPWLYLADLMVTDYGGASLEFVCMDKPVIYLDCPEFFDMRGHDVFEKQARETGFILDDPERLLDTIEKALDKDSDPHSKIRKKMKKRLLYNPGTAAINGFEEVYKLINQNTKAIKNI